MNHSCLPEHGWFSCLSKGTKKCMPITRACDGYADCDDGADEGGQCSKFQACYHFLAINTILRVRFDYKLLKRFTLPK